MLHYGIKDGIMENYVMVQYQHLCFLILWNTIWQSWHSSKLFCYLLPSNIIFHMTRVLARVTSQMTFRIADWPHKSTRVFSACFVLTRTLTGKFPVGHPSKDYSKSSTLNYGVLMEWATKKKMHLVDIGSTKQFL